MRSRFWLAILMFSYLTPGSLWGQAQPEKINLQQPDFKQIQRKTFDAVNALRISRKLPALVWDDLLLRAAKDQADFLLEQEVISHNQKNRGKEYPFDRVRIHGGLCYSAIAENLASVTLGQKTKPNTSTYASTGTSLALLWKNSSGHYKNIISKEFNNSAIAVSYNSQTRQLICVQVFGKTNIDVDVSEFPDYSAELLTLPSSVLPFNLKEYNPKKKDVPRIRYFMKMQTINGHLIGSYKMAKKVFGRRKDGIVHEFIPLEQFDSSSVNYAQVPNRRNGLYELNGVVSKPIYRRQMLRYSRRYAARSFYSLKIFGRVIFFPLKRPPEVFFYPLEAAPENTECNLFYVRNKGLAAFRQSTRVPAEFFELPFPEFQFQNSFVSLPPEKRYNISSEHDTVSFKISYGAGDVAIKKEEMEEIHKGLREKNGKIVEVQVNAFASVEGDEFSNDRIAKARLKTFLDFASPLLDSASVRSTIHSSVQWEMFLNQIKSTSYAYLSELDKESMRKKVNELKKDSLLSSLLDDQRYSLIKLVLRTDRKEYIGYRNVLKQYDSLKKVFLLEDRPPKKLVDALVTSQCNMYFEIAHSPEQNLEVPVIITSERFPEFEYHDLIYRFTITREIDDKFFYQSILRLASSKYFPKSLKDQALYNNYTFLLQRHEETTINEFVDSTLIWCPSYRNVPFRFKEKSRIHCNEKRKGIHSNEYHLLSEFRNFIMHNNNIKNRAFSYDDAWRYFYLNRIRQLIWEFPNHSYTAIYSNLEGFKKYFHPDEAILSDEERLRLALLYCAISRFDIAKRLVQPSALSPNPDKEIYKLYLSLLAAETKNDEFVDMLINSYEIFGQAEWCSIWSDQKHLTFLLLEDYKLKKFYNCKCDR